MSFGRPDPVCVFTSWLYKHCICTNYQWDNVESGIYCPHLKQHGAIKLKN